MPAELFVSPDGSSGLVNQVLHLLFGMEPIAFLQEPGWYYPIVILEVIWKDSSTEAGDRHFFLC